jgi:hypothetical protein
VHDFVRNLRAQCRGLADRARLLTGHVPQDRGKLFGSMMWTEKAAEWG